ncbi:hypothetical protein, partial [Amycolatopsis solani]
MAGSAATAAVDAWLDVVGTPGGVVESFVRALGELDVSLRRGDDGPRHGVLAFDSPGPAVADRLRAVSRDRPG